MNMDIKYLGVATTIQSLKNDILACILMVQSSLNLVIDVYTI